MVTLPPNNAINADGLGQRAFGASPNPAGYSVDRQNSWAATNKVLP